MNATLGFTGFIFGLFGVWAYFASVKKPHFLYYVSNTRTPIVQTGKLDNFSVILDGTAIQGDLSSAEIQIWNDGKEPIRKGDILKPVTISMESNRPIYKVESVITRDVIGGGVITTNYHKGTFTVDWNILEKGDGIKLQIIYGGNVKTQLHVGGAFVGQSEPVEYQLEGGKWFQTMLLGEKGLTMIIALVTSIYFTVRMLLGKTVKAKAGYLFAGMIIFLAVIFAGTFVNVYMEHSARPPFGF